MMKGFGLVAIAGGEEGRRGGVFEGGFELRCEVRERGKWGGGRWGGVC